MELNVGAMAGMCIGGGNVDDRNVNVNGQDVCINRGDVRINGEDVCIDGRDVYIDGEDACINGRRCTPSPPYMQTELSGRNDMSILANAAEAAQHVRELLAAPVHLSHGTVGTITLTCYVCSFRQSNVSSA